MHHPLADDFSQLKDSELEEKISELTKKYWQSTNPSVQHQITLLLDMYKIELETRRAKIWQEQYQKRDQDLDNLIKVS